MRCRVLRMVSIGPHVQCMVLQGDLQGTQNPIVLSPRDLRTDGQRSRPSPVSRVTGQSVDGGPTNAEWVNLPKGVQRPRPGTDHCNRVHLVLLDCMSMGG